MIWLWSILSGIKHKDHKGRRPNKTRASRTTGAKGNNFLQIVTSFNHQVASRK